MPQISSFYGIAIYMYFDDHAPPHFHAEAAEYSAKVEIASGSLFEGELTRRDARLVCKWTSLHRTALEDNWLRARDEKPLAKIDPLP